MKDIVKVTENIKKYFERNLTRFDLCGVVNTEDDRIYKVIGKTKENPFPGLAGDYTVWMCWNEETQSLNWGHYDLSLSEAMKLLAD